MADESKSRRSSPLSMAWNFLPRIELARVFSSYRIDFTDKLAGDVAAGIVVAGEPARPCVRCPSAVTALPIS